MVSIIVTQNRRLIGEYTLLDGDVHVIGRLPGNAIPLNYPFLMDRHVALRLEGDEWYALDLSCGNSTIDTEPFQRKKLQSGDQIEIADLTFKFYCDNSARQWKDHEYQGTWKI